MILKFSRILFLLVTLNCNGLVFGQETVNFIQEIPIIDGVADNDETIKELQSFAVLEKSNENNPDVDVKYHLSYGSSFLYLYLEIKENKLITRDRAYQNGDGFHMVIAKPQTDASDTDEFYVLNFSPDETSRFHKGVWYYNVDLGLDRFGEEVKYKTFVSKEKVSMELLLPWNSIHPYHPWFSDNIGLNLCFVKAIGENEKNRYFIKKDDKTGSEQSKRKYVYLKFVSPHHINKIESSLQSRNIHSKEYPKINIAGFMERDTNCNYSINIYSGENTLVSRQYFKKSHTKGYFTDELLLDKKLLVPGGYRINISSSISEPSDHFLTVFPDVNFSSLKKRLSACKNNVSKGSFNTLSLYMEECKEAISDLYDYEHSFEIRSSLELIKNSIEKIECGENPFVNKKGVYRRAFVSELDSTFRPYAVYVPNDYNGNEKYPLLVYLHGSGESEKALFSANGKVKEGFIILAPNGRGTSNWYATNGAQTDIKESIHDVVNNFNIDTDNIILSGFSMGGYGVYRTYFENPQMYKAIAILSGHPNLDTTSGIESGIDFANKENLKIFKDVPIFVFHGEKDLNCNFSVTEGVVKQLRDIGCNVTFIIENIGHSSMNAQNFKKYEEWLSGLLK